MQTLAWASVRPCEAEDDSLASGKLRKNVKAFSPQARLLTLSGSRLTLRGFDGEVEEVDVGGCTVRAFSETIGPEKRW